MCHSVPFTDVIEYIPAKLFHRYKPICPVIVSMGLVLMLKIAKPMFTRPQTMLSIANRMVHTNRPKLNNPCSRSWKTTNKH